MYIKLIYLGFCFVVFKNMDCTFLQLFEIGISI